MYTIPRYSFPKSLYHLTFLRMPYDEHLAERVRKTIGKKRGITEQKAFGGVGFMLHGNMACGIIGEKLMLRLGADGAAAAMEEEHVTPMDFTGRPMKTMVFIKPGGTEADADLQKWIGKTLAFAKTLPKK